MKARSLLFLNRVYPPAEGATGQLLSELAPALVRAGWQVTVVTSAAPGARAVREECDGVRIERIRTRPFTRTHHWRRALCYLLLYPAFVLRALLIPRADILVVMSDPPLLVVFGVLLKWLTGARLVHWAQDLYPDLAEETGVLRRGSMVARCLRRLATWALRRCDRVVVIGRCMQAALTARGLEPGRLLVIPNWSLGGSSAKTEEMSRAFRADQQLQGHFVVMYSGNFGLAHSFEAMLDAVQRLRTLQPAMLFLFIGDGPQRGWFEEQVRARELSNVRLLPPQPRDRFQAVLSAADVHLASMRTELCGLVVPSKVYGVLAAGKPCVFLGPRQSEVSRLLEENGCGTVLESSDGSVLADCLAAWAKSPARLQAAAAKSKQLQTTISLEKAVEAFLELFNELPIETSPVPQAKEEGEGGAGCPRPSEGRGCR